MILLGIRGNAVMWLNTSPTPLANALCTLYSRTWKI